MEGEEENMKVIGKGEFVRGGNENIFGLMQGWGGSVVLGKEMEWGQKKEGLKDGIE